MEDMQKGFTPMERSHLRYLLLTDPEILELKRNQEEVNVHTNLLLYGFGLFNSNVDQIKELENDIATFRASRKESVFSLYIGAVNHWVCIVAHKTKEQPHRVKFYLLDSYNAVYLDKSDDQLPEIQEASNRERVFYGMEPNKPFTSKMSV
jgi:hypothetical protein